MVRPKSGDPLQTLELECSSDLLRERGLVIWLTIDPLLDDAGPLKMLSMFLFMRAFLFSILDGRTSILKLKSKNETNHRYQLSCYVEQVHTFSKESETVKRLSFPE